MGLRSSVKCAIGLLGVLALTSAPAAADEDSPVSTGAEAADQASSAPTNPDPDKLKIAFYPLFGWAPFFSSNISVPPLPGGGGGQSIGGSTNLKINGALAMAFDVSVKKWLLEGEGMWASVSAKRQSPYAKVSSDVKYGDLFIGRKVWRDFSFLAGARRMTVGFDATVGNLPTFKLHPGVWDPLIGVEWRRFLGHKLYTQVRFDGGGFGVGSNVDIDGQFRLEWRFAKHFGTAIGYQALHTEFSGTVSRTILNTTLTYPWQYHQTFHGPILAFGIYF